MSTEGSLESYDPRMSYTDAQLHTNRSECHKQGKQPRIDNCQFVLQTEKWARAKTGASMAMKALLSYQAVLEWRISYADMTYDRTKMESLIHLAEEQKPVLELVSLLERERDSHLIQLQGTAGAKARSIVDLMQHADKAWREITKHSASRGWFHSWSSYLRLYVEYLLKNEVVLKCDRAIPNTTSRNHTACYLMPFRVKAFIIRVSG